MMVFPHWMNATNQKTTSHTKGNIRGKETDTGTFNNRISSEVRFLIFLSIIPENSLIPGF